MARGRILVLIALALGAAPRAGLAQPDGARRDTPPGKPAPPKPPVMTKAPVLLQAVNPVYPPAALAAGKTADVKVRLHIDAAGVVTQVDVVTPVGDGFDEAARAAAQQYVFDPAEFDGKPGPIVVETTIHFVIEQEEAPPPPPPPPPAETAEPPPLGHAGNMKAPITIRGEVLELAHPQAPARRDRLVEELGLDAITDDRGRFAFHGVAPGSYHLIVAADALRPGPARGRAGQGRGARPQGPAAPVGRQPVRDRGRGRARGHRGHPAQAGPPAADLGARHLRRPDPRDPGPARHRARARSASASCIIRGSNPDDTGIFIDGHRVPGIFHFLGGPSILNPEFVDSIDLYPGGFPARFGRLHGGVVAIETRPSKSDGVHGSASSTSSTPPATSARRSASTCRSRSPRAARTSTSSSACSCPSPAPASSAWWCPYYYDGQARIDWDLGKNGRASVLALVSSDQLRIVNSSPDEAASFKLNSSIDFFRIIGKYERPLMGDLKLTLSPAYGRDQVTFSGAQAEAMGPYTSLRRHRGHPVVPAPGRRPARQARLPRLRPRLRVAGHDLRPPGRDRHRHPRQRRRQPADPAGAAAAPRWSGSASTPTSPSTSAGCA